MIDCIFSFGVSNPPSNRAAVSAATEDAKPRYIVHQAWGRVRGVELVSSRRYIQMQYCVIVLISSASVKVRRGVQPDAMSVSLFVNETA